MQKGANEAPFAFQALRLNPGFAAPRLRADTRCAPAIAFYIHANSEVASAGNADTLPARLRTSG